MFAPEIVLSAVINGLLTGGAASTVGDVGYERSMALVDAAYRSLEQRRAVKLSEFGV